jgi:hypothetical protein
MITKKKNGKNKIGVGFRQLNSLILDEDYGLLLIFNILDDVNGHIVYSKIHCKLAYNLIRKKPDRRPSCYLILLQGYTNMFVCPLVWARPLLTSKGA